MSRTRPKKFQIKYLRAGLVSRGTIETKNIPKIEDFFEGQKRRIFDNIGGTKSLDVKFTDGAPVYIFDINVENEILREVVYSMHAAGLRDSYNNTFRVEGVSSSNIFTRAEFFENINILGNKITGTVNETTLKILRDVVAEAVSSGSNINAIQDAISSKIDAFSGQRARMIARTESRMAYDAGAHIAYKDLGVEFIDIVGCTQFEENSDCGAQKVPLFMLPNLRFHPNHVGVPAPHFPVNILRY